MLKVTWDIFFIYILNVTGEHYFMIVSPGYGFSVENTVWYHTRNVSAELLKGPFFVT
jgi:hypothetical protein